MSEPLQALEFYCGIGPWPSACYSPFIWQHSDQVGCTMLSQGAASGAPQQLSALLIGTNLLVPFTRQTMVLASHTGYACPSLRTAHDSRLPFILRSTLVRWMRTCSNRSTRTSGFCHPHASRIRCSTHRRRGPRTPAHSLSCT